MKYTKEVNDFETALGLSEDRATSLRAAIKKAYDQEWHDKGPNVDQINYAIAPYLKTPEEGFYVATIIVSDILSAIQGKVIPS